MGPLLTWFSFSQSCYLESKGQRPTVLIRREYSHEKIYPEWRVYQETNQLNCTLESLATHAGESLQYFSNKGAWVGRQRFIENIKN